MGSVEEMWFHSSIPGWELLYVVPQLLRFLQKRRHLAGRSPTPNAAEQNKMLPVVVKIHIQICAW